VLRVTGLAQRPLQALDCLTALLALRSRHCIVPALSFVLPGTEWGGGWDLYMIYINSVGFLPSALANLAVKDIFVASTADDLTADITSASVLWQLSSPSCCHSSEMNTGTRDHRLAPD